MSYTSNCNISLDTRGLVCPQPLLKAKRALQGLSMGQTIQIISTDPSSVIDFNAFVRRTPHILLKAWQQTGHFYFILQKGTQIRKAG